MLKVTTHRKIHGRAGSTITIKNGWEGGNTDICMPIYSADALSFKITLQAKLELRIQLVKEFLCSIKVQSK